MKILKVRFKNLNSLEGEWEIDFSHPAYTSNGIFAITGPTGAGKTTLLDAICLALYGRTPRLKILSKSVNEVMTRQTGDCFAEVIFVTLKGVFRCHWSHHRSRKKPQGDLQQPRHEMVDHEKNVVLENMIKNVAAAVEDVTGMNFDQFTRSIMLAQGSFAAFLQASADDRAPLLEQITGTDIYSRISQEVHHHTAGQLRKYTQMTEELDGLKLLSEEEKETLKNTVSEKLAEAETLRKTIATAQNSITWLENIETLKKDIRILEDEHSKVNEQLQGLASQRSSLQRAKIASLHVPQHQHLERLKKLQSEEIEEISTIKEEINSLQDSIRKLNKQNKQAIILFQQAEKALQDERKVVIEVKTLDSRIEDRDTRSRAEEKKIHAIDKQITQIRSHIDNLSRQDVTQKKERDAFHTYLQEHEIDSSLVENMAVFTEKNEQLQFKISNSELLHNQLNDLQKQKKRTTHDLEKYKLEHAQTAQDYAKAATNYSEVHEEISIIRKNNPNLHHKNEQLTTRLSELHKLESVFTEREKTTAELTRIKKKIENYVHEYDNAEKEEHALQEQCTSQQQIVAQQEEILVLNRRIKSYEEERTKLQPGAACPLCGSTTHPFSEVKPPPADNDIGELEKEKTLLLSLQKRITELQTQMIFNRQQRAEYEQRIIDAEKRIASFEKQLESICQNLALEQSNLFIEVIHGEIEKVDAERSALAQERMNLDTLDNIAAELRKHVDTLKEKHNFRERQLSAETMKLENLHEKEDALIKELHKLDGIIRDDFKRLNAAFTPFGFSSFERNTLSEILGELDLRKKKWLEAKETVDSLEKELRQTEKELQKEQTVFESTIRERETIQRTIDILTGELDSLRKKRKKIYGEKDPDSEELKYRELLSTAMQHRDETRDNQQKQENRTAFLTDRLERLLASSAKRVTQIKDEQLDFEHGLKKDGFSDVEDFTTAVMSEEQIIELESLLKDVDENSTRLQTLLQDKKKMLHAELARNLSSESISSLQDHIRANTSLLNQILQDVGKLEGKIEDNEKLLREQKQKRLHLADQEKELLRWQKLDGLIGSASGKKFRNFAQGITFEIMVELANKNLQKMSDRYILIRDSRHPLNLEIIDNYRAGDIRSTQNLSGGESFLVSLSLALGLSNMAGNNIRVDSFFLDEGFGTLDEETLDIALQTLAGLQQDGKMIGIISHVSLLKERLDTQIQLVPGPGGHSIIEGPGVRSL